MAEAMTLYYLAHPVAGDVVGNRAKALAILRHLRTAGIAVIAPWLAELEAMGVTTDRAENGGRESALRLCEAVAARCDGVIAVGRPWSRGMAREIAACDGQIVSWNGGEVGDLVDALARADEARSATAGPY